MTVHSMHIPSFVSPFLTGISEVRTNIYQTVGTVALKESGRSKWSLLSHDPPGILQKQLLGVLQLSGTS